MPTTRQTLTSSIDNRAVGNAVILDVAAVEFVAAVLRPPAFKSALARISHTKLKKAVASWHNSFVEKDSAKKEQQPYDCRV
jgi:hypothetical protein